MADISVPPLPQLDYGEIRYSPGFLGYAVTDTGEVWSCRGNRSQPIRKTWHKLRPIRNKRYGHLSVSLSGKRRYVHDLILEAFIGPCPQGLEGCHYDGNPANNFLYNIRWDTRKSNVADTKRHGRTTSGERNHRHKLTAQQVDDIRQSFNDGATAKSLALEYHMSPSNMTTITQVKSWVDSSPVNRRPLKTWKLSNDDVRMIRRLHQQKVSLKDIADIFHIDFGYVSTIAHFRAWKNVY